MADPQVQEAWSADLYLCPECSYTGISGVTGGVGPWPGDGKVRCPSSRCEYRTVMEHMGALVPLSVAENLAGLLDALDRYVGHVDCGVVHGAPECNCDFDDLYTRVRAAVRAYPVRREEGT